MGNMNKRVIARRASARRSNLKMLSVAESFHITRKILDCFVVLTGLPRNDTLKDTI